MVRRDVCAKMSAIGARVGPNLDLAALNHQPDPSG
jgi:hypothetical protein